VVTTLHGTDITLMGADPTFAEIIRFSIEASDQVTAVSGALRKTTLELLAAEKEISVIHNFLDLEEWRRVEVPGICQRIHACGQKILVHASNFRAVKRPQDVIQVFNWVRHSIPSRLLLIGEGPELAACQELSDRLGLRDLVMYMGVQDQVVPLLSTADLFLLPSSQEAFGLAALEAMACGAPVVASTAGGLPEVVVEGETGHLLPVGDVESMASKAIALLSDPVAHGRMSQAAVEHVRAHFGIERVIPQYEAVYAAALGVGASVGG
jgi:N-acetyl-alpha-D-glucosaminyl L-malate synthase BshA